MFALHQELAGVIGQNHVCAAVRAAASIGGHRVALAKCLLDELLELGPGHALHRGCMVGGSAIE
jgi:hypothetical protein